MVVPIEGEEKSNRVIKLAISANLRNMCLLVWQCHYGAFVCCIDLLSGAKRCLIGTRKMVNYAWAN